MASMRLRHIEIFYAVYATGSISNAARMLNVTQPTVSQILRHAEDQLGYKLFHRVRGRLAPTEEAESLFPDTREIYKKISTLRVKAQNLKKRGDGCLRIAAVHSLGLQILPKAVAYFGKAHPDLEFDVQIYNYSELINALNNREKDVGLVINCPEINGFSKRKLSNGEAVCIYSQGEFDNHPTRLEMQDLANRDFVGVSESGPIGDLLNQRLLEEDMVLKSTITTQTLYVSRDLVAQGVGVSIVDEYTARSLNDGSLSLKGFNPPLNFTVDALFLEDHLLSKTSEKFLNFLKQEYLSTALPRPKAKVQQETQNKEPVSGHKN